MRMYLGEVRAVLNHALTLQGLAGPIHEHQPGPLIEA